MLLRPSVMTSLMTSLELTCPVMIPNNFNN